MIAFPSQSQLVDVQEGRLFCRRNAQQQLMVVGVVPLPDWMPTEVLVGARLNDRLRLEPTGCAPTRIESDGLGELDATNLLTSLRFAAGALPDALQVFVRKTALPQFVPGTFWAYVIGAATTPIPAIGQAGLYEMRPQSPLALIDPSPQSGMQMGQVLRKTLWGPGGAYGMAHSLEPATYGPWVKSDRQRTARQDPMFRKFCELMAAHGPESVYYTRAERQERERISSQVMKKLLAAEEQRHEAAVRER